MSTDRAVPSLNTRQQGPSAREGPYLKWGGRPGARALQPGRNKRVCLTRANQQNRTIGGRVGCDGVRHYLSFGLYCTAPNSTVS